MFHSSSSHATRSSYRKRDSKSLEAVLWVLSSMNDDYKVPQALLGFQLQVYAFLSPEREVIRVSSSFQLKPCLLQGPLQVASVVLVTREALRASQ